MLLMGTDSMMPLPGTSINSFSLAARISRRVCSPSATVVSRAFCVGNSPYRDRCSVVAVPRHIMVSARGSRRD